MIEQLYNFRHPIILLGLVASFLFAFGMDDLIGDNTRYVVMGLNAFAFIVYFLFYVQNQETQTQYYEPPQMTRQVPMHEEPKPTTRQTFQTINEIKPPQAEKQKDVFESFEESKNDVNL